jgi:hypothetical protein
VSDSPGFHDTNGQKIDKGNGSRSVAFSKTGPGDNASSNAA